MMFFAIQDSIALLPGIQGEAITLEGNSLGNLFAINSSVKGIAFLMVGSAHEGQVREAGVSVRAWDGNPSSGERSDGPSVSLQLSCVQVSGVSAGAEEGGESIAGFLTFLGCELELK
jgi:hypothetical protein